MQQVLNYLIPDCVVVFNTSDGSVSLDLVEAQMVKEEIAERHTVGDKIDTVEVIREFQKWIEKKAKEAETPVELSYGHAYSIHCHTGDLWDDWKKKHDAESKSLTDLGLIHEQPTNGQSSHSRKKSRDSKRKKT